MRKRYLLRGSLLLLILIVPVLIDPGSQAMAQACTRELTDADQAYTLGRFDEAINLLNRCLDKSNATSQERQQAYRLLALSSIGKDDSRRAREHVQALLRINPNYQPDAGQDPPPFVQMVRDAKREAARAPEREKPEVDDGGGGIPKLLLIGGGVALAALATVLFAGGSDDEGGGNGGVEPTTINEREPNNGPTQAQILRGNPPITVNGNAEVNDHSEIGFTHQDGSFDDFEDWYQVTISTPGIRINLSGLSSDCDLFLLQPSPLTIPLGGISGNEGTQPELIDLPTLAAGTYLIAVTILDPDPQGPASSPYRLVVNGAVEQIQRFGGAEVSDHFRLEALTIPRRSVARTGRSARRGLPSVLTLSAYREGRRASVVRAGFEEDAAPGLDGFDQYAPPGYFEAASLRLVRQISSESRVELASEFRPWGDAGQRFELMLKTPAHAPIELRVEGLEAFAGYDVYLIDREKAIAYDLHTQPVLTLTSSQALHRFTLVVGDAAFARAARAELAPEAVHLSNYPNPFNPRTSN